VTHLFGARLVTVPARNYAHDLEAMLRAATLCTRVVFVANPNNPTGTLASAEQLLHFVNSVPPSVLLVMDEAYIEFLEQSCDLLPLIRKGSRPNLLILRTFSKIYGLAGLRIGYGIGDTQLVSALEKVRQPFNINAAAQAGALAALDDIEHVARTRQNNWQGLRFLEDSFRNLGLEFIPSAANFILVHVGDGQKVVTELQKLGVITRAMAGYQLPEWVRISVGTPAENARCVAALKDAVQR
jgi:histidinol-phosphate aminotransferase